MPRRTAAPHITAPPLPPEQSSSTLVIANPGAGGGRAEDGEDLEAWRDALRELDDVSLQVTQGPGHAAELAREGIRRGARRIVAAGGDGTINAVLQGLAPNFDNVVLGILPLGTGNDLARSLGIARELPDAIATLRAGRVCDIDIVRMTSGSTAHHFLNAASCGFGGAVSDRTDSQMKKRWGPFAYLLSAAATLPDLTEYRFALTLDGHAWRINAYSLVIANGRYVAGGVPIAPDARLDDGLLDLVVIPSESLTDAALAVPEILLGRHADSERVVTVQARKVELVCEPEMPVNLDGELRTTAAAQFHVLQRALRVIVGEPAEALGEP